MHAPKLPDSKTGLYICIVDTYTIEIETAKDLPA